MLCPLLALALLGFTACGDFQDPSAGQPGGRAPILTAQEGPEVGPELPATGIPQPEEPGLEPPTAAAESAPAPTDPWSAPPPAPSSADPGYPGVTPVQPGATEPLPAAAPQPFPWGAPAENPPPAFVEGPDRTPKVVTISWDPSTTSDVLGYKVLIIAGSGWTYEKHVIVPKTELRLLLPRGESYMVTVTAYNSGGESPPAPYFRFDHL